MTLIPVLNGRNYFLPDSMISPKQKGANGKYDRKDPGLAE
jgi:hypothetical protein